MRWVAALLLVGLIGASGCDGGPQGTARIQSRIHAPDRPVAPSPLPRGWFVLQAALNRSPSPSPELTRVYARSTTSIPDASVATGVGEEPNIGVPAPRTNVDIHGTSGVLGRRDGWTVVTWEPAADLPVYIAARGLGRASVLRLARAARYRERDHSLRIPDDALPDGFGLRAAAPIGPEGPIPSREQVMLVDGTGAKRITLDAFRGSAAAGAVARFWALDGGAPLVFDRTRVRRVGTTTVLARGSVSPGRLDAILEQTRPLGTAEWDALRARVLELPLTAFLTSPRQPGAGPPVLLGGVVGEQRWGVSITFGPGPADRGIFVFTMHEVLEADRGVTGGGGGTSADLAAPIASVGGGSFSGGDMGELLAGIAPAATAELRIEPAGSPTSLATLGPVGPDPSHRWYAAYLPGTNAPVTLVALDASGHELARRAGG